MNRSLLSTICALTALSLSGCGGGGGGSVVEEEDDDPVVITPTIDIQLVSATVHQGVELLRTTYKRDDNNQAVIDETTWHLPKVDQRRLFLTLEFTQDCCRVVDIEVEKTETATKLDVVETRTFNLDGEYAHVFSLEGEHVDAGLQLQITIDPDDEIRQEHDGANDVLIDFEDGERLESEVFKIVLVPIVLDGHTFEADDIDEEDLMEKVREILPLSAYEVSVRETWTEEIEGYSHPSDYASKIWCEESGPGEYYYGLSEKIGEDGFTGGIAASPGYTAGQVVTVYTDDVLIYAPTRANELGHNLSLAHSQGCDAPSPDPDYPYADEFIGDETGWLMWRPEFVEEGMGIEIMSYCTAQDDFRDFISWYQYEKEARFYEERIQAELEQAISSSLALAAAQESGGGPPKGGIVIAGTYDMIFQSWSIDEVVYTPHDARVLNPHSTTHELAVINAGTGVMIHHEPILVSGWEHDPDVWTQYRGVRIPVPPHADIYLEIRERKGRLVMQQDIPREFKKLDIPQGPGN